MYGRSFWIYLGRRLGLAVITLIGAIVAVFVMTHVLPGNPALVKAGVLRREKDGVRLLGTGEIKSKVAFSVAGASKSAIAAVEKAGGSVQILAPKKEEGDQAA